MKTTEYGNAGPAHPGTRQFALPKKRWLATLASALILSACGGGDDGEASSSASSVTSSVASSSSSSVASSVASSSSAPASSVPASSAASSSPSSVASSTSSVASSSASSTPTVGASFSDFTVNVADGEDIYRNDCIACHKERGVGGGTPLEAPISVEAFPTSEALFQYVAEYMPYAQPGSCVGQCAADVTAYMETWRVVAASCDAEDPVLYGQRSYKLLTSYEYRNSVEDLFPGVQVPAEFLETTADVVLGGFPNHHDAVVTGSVGDKYYKNATAIADWAIQNGLPFECTEAAACAQKFVNEFAYKAFRRPLVDDAANEALEITAFQELFANAPTVTAGLREAIVAALISPNFLYRSEVGIPVAEAREKGWNTAPATGGTTGGNADGYQPAAGGTTVNGVDFATHSTGENNGDGSWNIYSDGNVSHTFSFTDPALLVINVKGNDYDNAWPLMTVSVGNQVIAMETVESYDFVEYKYLVTGVTGNQQVTIAFSGDQGREPYGTPGNDKDLHVGDVTVAAAEPIDATAPVEADVSTLEIADPTAYVLDPYEFASALSYLYTGSLPDEELLQAASSGALNTDAGVEAQITRLMGTARGEQHMKRFVSIWMRTDLMYGPAFFRDNAAFTPAVRDAMVGELEEFFWHIFDNEEVPFSDFYAADYTFTNATLADFYGIARNANGAGPDDFVMTPTTERGGVVTTGAFLTTFAHPDQTAPILRGVNVREKMLCHHIDPPPETLGQKRDQLAAAVEALKADGTMTTRVYYETITSDPDCASCHATAINPLGGGLEDFDQVGLKRTTQLDLGLLKNVIDVDFAGELIGLGSLKDTSESLSFSGAKDLSDKLATLPATQACLVEKAFRFGAGRPLSNLSVDKLRSEALLTEEEANDFNCAGEMLSQTLDESGQSPKAMFKKLGTLDLIRFRR